MLKDKDLGLDSIFYIVTANQEYRSTEGVVDTAYKPINMSVLIKILADCAYQGTCDKFGVCAISKYLLEGKEKNDTSGS